jgi:hypothetical protein
MKHKNRLMVVLVALLILLSGSAVGYAVGHTAIETSKINSVVTDKTAKLCDFFGSIGVAPIPAQSSKFGVEIVEYSREAYYGLSCPRILPPPSDILNQLATKYGVIKVR